MNFMHPRDNYSIIPSSGSGAYLWVVLILIAVVAFFLYKKSKKKK
jgi:LPXTG-motif cell wall-anchored protein